MIQLPNGNFSPVGDDLRTEIDAFREHTKTLDSLRRKAPKNDPKIAAGLRAVNVELKRLLREWVNGDDSASAYIWRYKLEDDTILPEHLSGPQMGNSRVQLMVNGTPGEYIVARNEIDRDRMRGYVILRPAPAAVDPLSGMSIAQIEAAQIASRRQRDPSYGA